MEAASMAIARGCSGGQVRRIHIIYFLSRVGHIEHPHLIRVHHLHRTGVYLRDVKRWMADLRGKDMPEAFAWSYKRRYKNGLVWQDLMDDDLITPISDNEYVLKGSEILPISPFANNAGKREKLGESDADNGIEGDEQTVSSKSSNQTSPDQNINDSPLKISSEIYEESPEFSSETSTLTEDSMKQEQGPIEFDVLELNKYANHNILSSVDANLLSKKKKRQGNIEKITTPSSTFPLSTSSSPLPKFAKRKHNASGASKMLRNLISCGSAADINDAALVTVNKADDLAQICREEKLGRRARETGNPWNQQEYQNDDRKSFDGSQKREKSGFEKQKRVPAAYKLVGAPTCSQCGKCFKPEKLHSHMKSCKGLRASTMPLKSNSPISSRESMNQLMAIS